LGKSREFPCSSGFPGSAGVPVKKLERAGETPALPGDRFERLRERGGTVLR
jgi:hypothetical protein